MHHRKRRAENPEKSTVSEISACDTATSLSTADPDSAPQKECRSARFRDGMGE